MVNTLTKPIKKKMSPTEIQMEAMRTRRNKDSRYTPGPSKLPRYSRWLRRKGEATYKSKETADG
jgi:hypothetical protein